MRCVTAQLSDPLHVWKSIKEHSQAACVRLQLCLPSTLSDTVYLLHSPPVLSFPLGFTLAQPHQLRWEAGGGGLRCHTNKHQRNQDPEKVQWERRCHFSHVALMGARRVNILIILFFTPPRLGSSGALHLGREVGKRCVGCSRWILTTHGGPSNSLFTRTTCSCHQVKQYKYVHCCHGYSSKNSDEPATLVNWLLCNYMQNRNYRHHSNQNNTRWVRVLCFNPFKGRLWQLLFLILI